MKDEYIKGETFQRIVEPGNSGRYWVIVGTDNDGTPFVSLPDFGVAATMAWKGYTTTSYVAEKLKGITIADAGAIAKILNAWDLEKSRSLNKSVEV